MAAVRCSDASWLAPQLVLSHQGTSYRSDSADDSLEQRCPSSFKHSTAHSCLLTVATGYCKATYTQLRGEHREGSHHNPLHLIQRYHIPCPVIQLRCPRRLMHQSRRLGKATSRTAALSASVCANPERTSPFSNVASSSRITAFTTLPSFLLGVGSGLVSRSKMANSS